MATKSIALQISCYANYTLLRELLKLDHIPWAASADREKGTLEVCTEAKRNDPRINEPMDNEELMTRVWLQEDASIPVKLLKWAPTLCFGG